MLGPVAYDDLVECAHEPTAVSFRPPRGHRRRPPRPPRTRPVPMAGGRAGGADQDLADGAGRAVPSRGGPVAGSGPPAFADQGAARLRHRGRTRLAGGTALLHAP